MKIDILAIRTRMKIPRIKIAIATARNANATNNPAQSAIVIVHATIAIAQNPIPPAVNN